MKDRDKNCKAHGCRQILFGPGFLCDNHYHALPADLRMDLAQVKNVKGLAYWQARDTAIAFFRPRREHRA